MYAQLSKAFKERYAIPQININGLLWIEGALNAAQKLNSPIILGTTDKIIEYLGGYEFICEVIKLKAKVMNISVPYIIHLDHGQTVENCFKAIDSGYDSVMYDGSNLSIEENSENTKKVVEYARLKSVMVEGEVGAIGGNEDGLLGEVLFASLEDCEKLAECSGLDLLAPALGSVHGKYKGEPNLNFNKMKEIQSHLNMPLVLHGASGISNFDLQKAIEFGHSKINFNTEINLAWSAKLRGILEFDNLEFNPKKILAPTVREIQKTVENIIKKCNSENKA